MKNSTRFCILTLVLSMLLAFVIFTLSAGGILVLDTSSRIFGLLIAFSCILLSALLLGSLSAARRSLRSVSCCVSLSAAGGGFLVISAFLTSFSPSRSGIAFSIGIALCFFFLSLLIGGVFCLLHGLSSQEREKRRTDTENAPRMTAASRSFGKFPYRNRKSGHRLSGKRIFIRLLRNRRSRNGLLQNRLHRNGLFGSRLFRKSLPHLLPARLRGTGGTGGQLLWPQASALIFRPASFP